MNSKLKSLTNLPNHITRILMRFSISFLSIILLYYGFLYRKGFQNSFSFMSCNWFSILSKGFFQRDIMLLNVFDKNGVCSGGSRISHEKKGDTDGFSDFLLKQQQTSRNRQGGSGGVGWSTTWIRWAPGVYKTFLSLLISILSKTDRMNKMAI